MTGHTLPEINEWLDKQYLTVDKHRAKPLLWSAVLAKAG